MLMKVAIWRVWQPIGRHVNWVYGFYYSHIGLDICFYGSRYIGVSYDHYITHLQTG
jgi:hypothetical protein